MLLFVCLFVCLVTLRPKSTAMVMAGRSVHIATLFPGIMNADSMGTSNVYLVSPLGLQCVSKVHEVL